MNYDKRADQLRIPSRNDVKTRNLSEKKRRDQFNMLINELCSMVSTNNRKMDKSTVLKSTIAFLKNYQEISVQSQAHEIKENWKPSFLSNDEFTQLMLEALDSFLLVFSQDGTILYASESITSLLGHLPGDVVNRSIFDLIHSEEKMQLYNVIASHSSGDNKETEISDTGGHKFSLTCHIKRGLLLPSDQQIYELVKLAGNVRLWNGDLSVDSDVESNYKASDIFSPAPADTVCFCCTVRLETSQLIREMSMVDDIQTQFTSKHSMEWKFLFLDHRAPPIIGYLPFELLGTSGYDYYHPDDLEKISNCHEQLMATGEGKSCPYRFLTKGQQWIWLKTRFFITYHQWNCKPEFIVCTHQLISYSDVRSQLRKTDGDEESHSSRCCSPSSYSVTSAGQAESKWSATSSQRSDSPDRSVTGHLKYESEAPQKPHSTAQLSPHTVISSEASPHTSQQPLQGILVPPNIFVHTASTRQSPPQELTPIVCQSPSSTVTNQAHSTSPVVHPPASPLVSPQVYLTPAQHQLHKQLQEKSQILQQAILQQQAELHQINSQLALSQTMPVQVQHSSPAPETTGTLMLGTSPSFPQYSSLPTFNRVAQTPSPVTQSEPLQQQQQQINNHHQQQQYFPFQFVQPQPMYSPLNSLSHPNNLPK